MGYACLEGSRYGMWSSGVVRLSSMLYPVNSTAWPSGMTRCDRATPKQFLSISLPLRGFTPTPGALRLAVAQGKSHGRFAQRGYAVIAVGQGRQLDDLAAQYCRPYPRVCVVPCTFEAWQDVPESYDVFLSAQAFHWSEPQYGVAGAAELLKTGGTIALVWTLDRSQGSTFWQATQPIYDTYHPMTFSMIGPYPPIYPGDA
jgi:hypothetical protein